jgi:predicted DNA-binding transcriptional regulator AlpA
MAKAAAAPGKRYIRRTEVAKKMSYSPSTVTRLAKTNPKWPKSIRISERIEVWDESEIDAFIESLKASQQNDNGKEAATAHASA